MLTKEDFNSAAKFIKTSEHNHSQPYNYDDCYIRGCKELLIHLAETNPQFDETSFLEACKK